MEKTTAAPICPSCSARVSPKAFDCPTCGHPLRKPRRGVFGKIFKWSLIVFNIAMLVWMVTYSSDISQMQDAATSDAERTGINIGASIVMNQIVTIWIAGAVVLGLATLLTRPSK